MTYDKAITIFSFLCGLSIAALVGSMATTWLELVLSSPLLVFIAFLWMVVIYATLDE